MVVQVLFDGSNQRRHVLEGATTQPLVGYFAEPALHQVEPGTGGRDKVKIEPRVTAEPGFHARMFVGAVIIHDQMQVQPGRGVDVNLLEETDKFLMPMPGHTVADHPAVEHAQRRKQGRCAVAFVIVCHRPAAPFLHRKTGLRPVEGLDLTLLVNAQNKGLVRRIEIQADNVAELLNEVLIAAELEGLDQMRLEVVLLPYATNRCFTDPLRFGHRARTPMRRIGGLGVQRCFDQSFDFSRRNSRNAARTGRVLFQPRQTKCQKTLPPELHRRPRNAQIASDVLAQHSIGGHPDDLCALHQSNRQDSSTNPGIQYRPLLGRQDDRVCPPAHDRKHIHTRRICQDIYDALHYVGFKLCV